MNKKALYTIITMLLIMCLGGCGDKKSTKEKTETTAENATPLDMPEPVTTEEVQLPPMDEEGFYLTDDYVETVGDGVINLMINPSDSSDIYMLLEAGQKYPRNGYNDSWSRVVVDGTNFYIRIENTVVTQVEEQLPEATSLDAPKVQLEKKIVIDPANQNRANVAQESIGPDSEETKPAASTGSVGATYGTKESELNLAYAMALKKELESRGYEVILTRESDGVDISNKARAEFANESGATVFIRIQANYSTNSELTGAMAMCMSSDSPYNPELYSDSHRLATWMLDGYVKATGVENRGLFETKKMTAINWSNIPVAVIDLGFLSNKNDEGNLVDAEFKDKAVKGIADGIDNFFE